MKPYILLGLAMLFANLSFSQQGRQKAEIFIQIEDRGSFTVQLDDEQITSGKGRFRFYDVYASNPTLSILKGNQRIFSKKVVATANERIIFSFSLRSGLKMVKQLGFYRNGQYALNDFDEYTDAYNTGIVPPRESNFENLLNMVKREAFDEEKIQLIDAFTTNERLLSFQVASLLKTFMKDENKMIAFKNILPVIADQQHVYTLVDVFTFNSSKEQFLNYLKQSHTPGPRYAMDRLTFDQLRSQLKKEAFDDQKTNIILAAVKQNRVTTAQVETLIKMYSFEDKALNLAKSIYPAVADPQRYFTLKENFKFISNQNAFLDFLGSHK